MQQTHIVAPWTDLLRVEGVGKSYPLRQSSRQQFQHLWARLMGKEPAHTFKALEDISFEIRPGESVGLIGENGAGKSTLLKAIAGVIEPSRGHIQRHGTVGALLELGAGFHPEYTGRDNVYLASALMGLSRSQTDENLEEILAFADIGSHIDQPVKHYSSGMVVRLGFAVTTSLNPSLLITDEVLAVGDESFQRKCIQWMERYLRNGGTLLLCSHSMYHIQKLCRKALWLDKGHVRMQGTAAEVTREYLAWHEARQHKPELTEADSRHNQAIYRVETMELSPQGDPTRVPMGSTLTVKGTLRSPDGRMPQVAVGIVRADGTPVYGVMSDMDHYRLQALDAHRYAYEIRFERLALLPGRYHARSHAMDPEGLRLFDHVEMAFDVLGEARELGFVRLEHQWQDGPVP